MLTKVKVRDIKPNPFQARKGQDQESIKSLAEEIGKVGLWAGALRGREQNGHVELCFGHRRLEAVKLLKWKEVDIDVVPLSDEEMALQALVENLQREGLNDADKGDGIAAYIKLRQESGNVSQTTIMDEVGRLLGFGRIRLQELLRIARFGEEAKTEVRQGNIGGTVAAEAERIGGEEFVKVAADKKLSQREVKELGQKLREIPDEAIKEKVREKVKKGEVTSPEEVVKTARRIEGRKKKDGMPPDLIFVIAQWTEQIKGWTGQLDQIASKREYIDYIDTAPRVAEDWRTAVKGLIERLDKFL